MDANEETSPQSANADSIPQFAMVVPLRSQVRLRLSLAHWAYFAHSARASCAPLGSRGAFWIVPLPLEVALPKASFFPKGKGAHEGRAQCAKQAVVSPVRQGKPRVSLRTSEARRAEVASTRSEAQCAATEHRAAKGGTVRRCGLTMPHCGTLAALAD